MIAIFGLVRKRNTHTTPFYFLLAYKKREKPNS